MEDLTHYSNNELSLRVFNIEPLYRIRSNQVELFSTLDELFTYTDEQHDELISDLAEDAIAV